MRLKKKKKKYLRDGQCRAPLFFKNIKTYASITIDVRMKNLGLKSNLKMRHYLNSQDVKSNPEF